MSEDKIRIFLVDDHKIFVKGIASLLGSEPDMDVKGYAYDGASVLSYLHTNPDTNLVITDVQMPVMNGIELAIKIKEEFPHIKLIGLSMFDKAEIIRELISAGAEGYLLKDIEKEELVRAIHEVMQDRTYYSTGVAKLLQESMENKDFLTKREREIIILIAKENTNAIIADKLFISEHTVESHRKNIFRKTKCKSIVGLVNYAFENKMV